MYDMDENFLGYWWALPMLPLMALVMNPKYKLRGVVFCIKIFYKNTCINKDDDDGAFKRNILEII